MQLWCAGIESSWIENRPHSLCHVTACSGCNVLPARQGHLQRHERDKPFSVPRRGAQKRGRSSSLHTCLQQVRNTEAEAHQRRPVAGRACGVVRSPPRPPGGPMVASRVSAITRVHRAWLRCCSASENEGALLLESCGNHNHGSLLFLQAIL